MIWLTISGAFLIISMVAFPIYQSKYETHTIKYPKNSINVFYRGTELTENAKQYMESNPNLTINDVVENFGNRRNII